MAKKITFNFNETTFEAFMRDGIEVTHWGNSMFKHKVSVKANDVTITFSFYDHNECNANPIDALECFIDDCLCATETFYDFCNELGYDCDSREAMKTYRECGFSLNKATNLGLSEDDLIELINQIREDKITFSEKK
jgi:hypothetical protein